MARKRRKRKSGKNASAKSRAEMTVSEYEKIAASAETSLRRYLGLMADRTGMTGSARKCVFAVIISEFRKRMATDEEFFNVINEFYGRRPGKPEQDLFLHGVVRDLCRDGRIRTLIAERHPEEYRLPEDRAMGAKLHTGLGGHRG